MFNVRIKWQLKDTLHIRIHCNCNGNKTANTLLFLNPVMIVETCKWKGPTRTQTLTLFLRISFLFHLFLSSHFVMFLISVFFGFLWQSCFLKCFHSPQNWHDYTWPVTCYIFILHLLFSSILLYWFAVRFSLISLYSPSSKILWLDALIQSRW